jgi:hypothetical protein
VNDLLRSKVKVLSDLMWDRRVIWPHVEKWLENFPADPATGPSERTHALFLLSHFTYFNLTLVRALLRALYRDLVQYPEIQRIRKRLRGTTDVASITRSYTRSLQSTRFLGVGNPAESGTHLLYYFRQENELETQLFVHSHDLFEGTPAAPLLVRGVRRLVFLDDFCGSGTQAVRYSKILLPRIRALSPTIKLHYYSLFATAEGLRHVRDNATLFHDVQTVCEIDPSFHALDPSSRYFRDPPADITRDFARLTCERHGSNLYRAHPLGFKDGQLLIGFAHNIPNNTLPIIWGEGTPTIPWQPLFRRYEKR